MFSILKQRTIAILHFLKLRKLHLGAFVFISVLFLASYFAVGIYASNTGHLSILSPQMAMAEDPPKPDAPAKAATPAEQAASASPSSATDGVGILMGWVIGILLAGASLMLHLAIFCLAFIIQIAGYNGYLSSTAVNVGWVMVRDITNMFFVVILLLVAFGTILGLEQYEWKKMLVKFFFAAVLVNFSRVICGVIIDVGQVVMITFVNGIAATAGGNLINAFSMDSIFSLSQNAPPSKIVDTKEIFTAALGALIFSSIILAMMLVFVFMLVSRLVVLWILIVLSPFAFVLSVIPQTQKYASQWWSEFGNHVVVGPAVVFFMWLSFAVVGGGQINTEISGSSAIPDTAKINDQDTAGVGGIMDWNKMSNFAIAIGILLVGAKTSQSLGTVGGSAMSKATDFGKKVAMVASGAGAAMWAGGKVKQGAVATAKWGAMNAPVVGGKAWVRRGQSIAAVAGLGWSKVNQFRDKKAKDWEKPIKDKRRAEEAQARVLKKLELEKKSGMYKGVEGEAAYAKKKEDVENTFKAAMTKIQATTTFGAVGLAARGFIASKFESEGRAEKRVKNLQEAAEKEKTFEEGEYSLSSSWGGRMKTAGRARADASERRQKAKGERYVKDKLQEYGEGERLELEIAINELNGAKKSGASPDEIKSREAAVAKISNDGLILAAIAAEQQNLDTKAKHDEEMARTEAVYSETKTGKAYTTGINLAEQGKKAAEDFIKTMKGHDLTHQFQHAAEEMAKIIAEGGPDMAEKLRLASLKNNYVGSLRQTTLLKEDEEAEHLAAEKAKEKARAGFFEIPKLGRATPSTAMDSMRESAAKQLKGMSAPDGAVLAASWIAHILQEKETLDVANAKEPDPHKHKTISDHQQATLFAATAHITNEAWTDDTIAEMSNMFKDLDAKKFDDPKNAQKKADVMSLKKVFGDEGLGLIKNVKDENGINTGAYSSQSNPENAAALQALVSTGGDVQLVRAHQQIEKEINAIEADPARENETKDYFAVAQRLASQQGADGKTLLNGLKFDEFNNKLRKSQTFLEEAASSFKKAALDAKHIQMGGHQGFDRNADMFRLQTTKEALKTMVGEASKRSGMESSQFHSAGTVDNELGRLIKIDPEYFRAIFSAVQSAQKAGNVLSRTVDQVAGYGTNKEKQIIEIEEGEKKGQSRGLIGGQADGREGFASSAEMIKNLILPALKGNAEAVKFIWAKKMGVSDMNANEGKVNLAIDMGVGADGKRDLIEGEYFSDFLASLNSRLGSLNIVGEELESAKKTLNDAIAVSRAKEIDAKDQGERMKARSRQEADAASGNT